MCACVCAVHVCRAGRLRRAARGDVERQGLGEELHRFYFMALSINVVVFVAGCHAAGDKLDEGFCQPSRPSQLIWPSPIRSSASSLQLVSLNPSISLSQALELLCLNNALLAAPGTLPKTPPVPLLWSWERRGE